MGSGAALCRTASATPCPTGDDRPVASQRPKRPHCKGNAGSRPCLCPRRVAVQDLRILTEDAGRCPRLEIVMKSGRQPYLFVATPADIWPSSLNSSNASRSRPALPLVTFNSPQSRSLLAGKEAEFIPFIGERDYANVLRTLAIARRIITKHKPRRCSAQVRPSQSHSSIWRHCLAFRRTTSRVRHVWSPVSHGEGPVSQPTRPVVPAIRT